MDKFNSCKIPSYLFDQQGRIFRPLHLSAPNIHSELFESVQKFPLQTLIEK